MITTEIQYMYWNTVHENLKNGGKMVIYENPIVKNIQCETICFGFCNDQINLYFKCMNSNFAPIFAHDESK